MSALAHSLLNHLDQFSVCLKYWLTACLAVGLIDSLLAVPSASMDNFAVADSVAAAHIKERLREGQAATDP